MARASQWAKVNRPAKFSTRVVHRCKVCGRSRAVYRDFHGRAKILAPIPPVLVLPEVSDKSKWWQGQHWYNDEEQQFVFIYESSIYGPNIYYNTKLVDPKQFKSKSSNTPLAGKELYGRVERVIVGGEMRF